MAGDDLFVVEADEFDQAFLTLYPTVAVVTNVEPDHLECYGSMAALEDAFVEFAGRANVAIVSADDAGARRVGKRIGSTVRYFGCAADADLRISDVVQLADRTEARIGWRDGRSIVLRLKVPGLHNLRNAVGALGVVDALGGEMEAAAAALAEFEGVGRRFERYGEFAGVAVVDDYAHHPTELAATLAAARQAYPGRRLVAVFQPHLYSRTAAHGQAMGEALAAADLVIVTEIYAAREKPIAGVSGRQVAKAAEGAGADARFEPTRAEVGRNRVPGPREGRCRAHPGRRRYYSRGPRARSLAERRLTLGWFARSRPRLGLLVIGAFLTVWLLWLGTPPVLRRLEFFRVRRVEIAGLQYLAPAKVIAALGLDSQASVFDDLSAAGRRLHSLPGIASAQVTVRLPGTVEIVLVEVVPVALAPGNGGMALLDASGKVLPYDPAASAPDLPVAASADRVVAGVLASVLEHDPVLFARVRTAWRVRDDVLLDVDGHRFWFGPAVTAEDIRAVMAVAQDLARQGRKYQELDGRFAGQVIVRRDGA